MKKIALIVMTVLLASCDGSMYYSEQAAVDESGWNPADSVVFDVDVDDTVNLFNFLIEVRNSVTYPYSNTFLMIGTTFPDGSIAQDTMEYPLADASGQWYGRRSGRYIDTRYFLRRGVRFPFPGRYHFAITNGMRDSAIAGLHDIGLLIEYSQPK